jgi:hypothetical protein
MVSALDLHEKALEEDLTSHWTSSEKLQHIMIYISNGLNTQNSSTIRIILLARTI